MTEVSFEEGLEKYTIIKLPVEQAYHIQTGFIMEHEDLVLRTNYTMYDEIVDWIKLEIKGEWAACVYNDEAMFGFIDPKEATRFRMRF